MLNITHLLEAEKAYEEMKRLVKGIPSGVLVQKMVSDGKRSFWEPNGILLSVRWSSLDWEEFMSRFSRKVLSGWLRLIDLRQKK